MHEFRGVIRRSLTMALLMTLCLGLAFSAQAAASKQEVLKAQEKWAAGLVAIGKAYDQGKDYQKVALGVVSDLYAYDHGQVLFKPTKAAAIQFRSSKAGALSYFVGHNKKFPEDKGFALAPWTKVQFHNAGIIINENVAAAMGNYVFTPKKGAPVTVEYTFVYEQYKDGSLKIVVHHSSLPYAHK